MKVLKTLIAVILGLFLLDFLLWSGGIVPLTNIGYRFISSAPDITINGKRLMYRGLVHDQNKEPYKKSDGNVQLYKSAGTPDQPPWIYVPAGNADKYYRYSYPRVPWKL